MQVAVYPGSFDPITNGHLDIVERSAKMFDQVIVAVLINLQKTPLFDAKERTTLITDSVRHLPNVRVDHFSGLLVNYLAEKGASLIVRGLRTVSDLEAELQLAHMNKRLLSTAETIFIPTAQEFSSLSSSIIKEIARHAGDVSPFVPTHVKAALQEKYLRASAPPTI